MKLSELLGVNLTVARPNAYQLLGLEQGESDPKTIQVAIDHVVQKLRANRAAVSAETWDKAARGVMEAKEILTNPQKKSQYDAKLLNAPVSVVKSPSVPSSIFTLDQEFAKRLPKLDPREPFDIARYSAWAQTHASEFDIEIESEVDQSSGVELLEDDDESGSVKPIELSPHDGSLRAFHAPQIDLSATHPRNHSRRKGFPLVGVIIGTLCVGLLGAILFFGNKVFRKMTILANAVSPDARPPQPAGGPATNVSKREPIDPVMGNLGKEPKEKPSRGFKVDDGSSPLSKMGEIKGLSSEFQLDGDSMEKPSKEPATEMIQTTPASPTPSATKANPQPAPTMAEPSADAIAAGAQAIVHLQRTLKELGVSASEAIVKAAVAQGATQEQRDMLASWERVWLYAREYDQGIRAAGGKLRGGEVVKIGDVPINFIESSAEKIMFKVQGRIKEYNFTDLPPSLADALCRLIHPPDQPMTKAYRVAYFALVKGNSAAAAHKEAKSGIEKLLLDPDAESEVNLTGLRDRIHDLLSTADK